MRIGIETKSVGPLLSWDVFMQGYRRVQQLADDRSAITRMAQEQHWKQSFDYDRQLFQLKKTILVTTPALRIIYASSSIYEMNGYHPEEVIGQTPYIFQGEETAEKSKLIIRNALKTNLPFESTIVNYRKDGSVYDCHIKGYPLFNRNNKLVHYIAFENVA